EPLPPAEEAAGKRFRRMRRHEGGMRQRPRPFPPEFDQVVAVGPVAMEEDHELLGRTSSGGGKPRSIELSGHPMSLNWDSTLQAKRRPRAARPSYRHPVRAAARSAA